VCVGMSSRFVGGRDFSLVLINPSILSPVPAYTCTVDATQTQKQVGHKRLKVQHKKTQPSKEVR
jgi:hypothetical protein